MLPIVMDSLTKYLLSTYHVPFAMLDKSIQGGVNIGLQLVIWKNVIINNARISSHIYNC